MARGSQKAEVWIYDAGGGMRDGWLELREEQGELWPADRAWERVTEFPPDASASTARVVLWADRRDKYIARLEVGGLQRWIICERLPALLRVLESLHAIVALGQR